MESFTSPEVIEAVRASVPKDKILVLFFSATESVPRPRYPIMLPVEDPVLRSRILTLGDFRKENRERLAEIVAPLIPDGYRFDFWYFVDRPIEIDWK